MFLNKINIMKGLDYIELEDGYIKISEFEQSELAFKKPHQLAFKKPHQLFLNLLITIMD